jgi:multiple sugar transport system substrate-binding protein
VTPFRGLTWDHPRGYAALERAAAEAGGIVVWDRQPLEGFESAPIGDICAGYDLVVLDHPHLGDALVAGCLQPLDMLMPAEVLSGIRAQTLGPCFASYEMDGHLWALPLDAAAQISAGCPELMTRDMPETLEDVDRLAGSEPGFVLSLAGPHAFLTLLSLCASIDGRFGKAEDAYFQPHHDVAIEIFLSLARRSHSIGVMHNPIALLNSMARGEISYCPLIFGYATFASREGQHPLAFRNAPRANPETPPRPVLGGTGIAVTRSCQPDRVLLAHLSALLGEDLQTGLIPQAHGQPSAEIAWLSPKVNAAVAGFYLHTVDSLRHAFVRPRHAGYVPAQTEAAAWLRGSLASATVAPSAVRKHLNDILRVSSLAERGATGQKAV